MAKREKKRAVESSAAPSPEDKATSAAAIATASSTSTLERLAPLLFPIAIFFLTFFIYWPSMHGDYLWDDEVMLTENRLVQNADGLKHIWFSTKPHDYFPLTYTSFWIEWRWWKMNPFGYHATNVFLHALGAILFWRVLLRMKIPAAWLAALYFAAHPVCVPSVSWIAERKNTLSLVFYLGSILFYLRSEQARDNPGKSSIPFYLVSLFMFLLALLAKTSVVVLPIVLMGCLWWQRQRAAEAASARNFRRDLLRLAPFFLLSLVLGLVTIWFQKHRAAGTYVGDDILTRVLGGGYALWFYLSKIFVPAKLVMIYPRWEISPASLVAWLPWMAWLGLLFALWKWRRAVGIGPLLAMSYFFVTLGPVLGIFNMSFYMHSRVADHLQYISVLGPIALFAGTFGWLWSTVYKAMPRGLMPLTHLPLLLLLAGLAWQRAHAFAESENLWRDNVKKNPAAWGAHNNLGLAVAKKGRAAEAMDHYRASIEAKSDYANAHNNLGLALAGEQKHEEALKHYEAALKSEPRFAEVHNNVGNVFISLGKVDAAIARYEVAIKLKRDFAFAHNNLAYALTKAGRREEAIPHFQAALQLKPDYAISRHNLANALSDLGRLDEAITEFQAAIRSNPNYAESHNSLGVAFAMKGDLTEATRYFTDAIRLQPGNAGWINNLAHALAQLGRHEEAAQRYEQLLKLEADDAEAHYSYGVTLRNLGQKEKAALHFREALRLKPDFSQAKKELDALGPVSQ